MGHWSRFANLDKMKHIVHGSTGGNVLCNEQHSHLGPSRLVHLHKWWLLTLLSWCEHFTTPKFLTIFKLLIFTLFNFWLLVSTLLVRMAFQILEVVEKWTATITMLLDWIFSIFALFINLSLSLVDDLKSSEALRLNIGGSGSTKLDDGAEGVNIGDLSNKFWRIFKTFLIVSSSMALEHSNTSSHCNVALSNPFSLLVPIFNSFKASQRKYFKFFLQKLNLGDAIGNLWKIVSTPQDPWIESPVFLTHVVTCKMFIIVSCHNAKVRRFHNLSRNLLSLRDVNFV